MGGRLQQPDDVLFMAFDNTLVAFPPFFFKWL